MSDFDSPNDIYGGAVTGNGHMKQPHVPSRPQGAPSSASRVARAAHRRDSSGRALPNTVRAARKPKPFPRMDIWNFEDSPVDEHRVKVLTEASVIDPKLLERVAKKDGLELSLQQGKAAKEAAVKVGCDRTRFITAAPQTCSVHLARAPGTRAWHACRLLGAYRVSLSFTVRTPHDSYVLPLRPTPPPHSSISCGCSRARLIQSRPLPSMRRRAHRS